MAGSNGTHLSGSRVTFDFPVVGIGASAGGITAFQTLLRALPASPGFAVIVVQHQLADQRSRLPELFGKWTPLRTCEVVDGMTLERDCLFVAPPDASVALEKGTFRTRPRNGGGTREGIDTIDAFFESLARDAGPRAIAVVLSGTGSDGAAGAIRVKQAGGMVFVQDPSTAMHDGMPRSAIATGAADHVMPVGVLARELLACGSAAYVRSSSATTWDEDVNQAVDGIVQLMRERAGFDLTGHRTAPLLYRIQRRMEVRRVPVFRDYLALLHDDAVELETLMRGIRIHVTEFFRDPAVWDALERDVIPGLFREAKGRELRVWTPACSSGEEAYSLAMLLAEQANSSKNPGDFKVFATDTSAEIVARASRGAFKASAVDALSPERRQRFFYAADGGLRVKRELREKLVFAPQDLLADPPFPDLDLVTCRNLLIYLEQDAARRVVALLHSVLRVGGYLLLGKSESVPVRMQSGFEELAPHLHIYRKTSAPLELEVTFPKRPARLRASKSSRDAVEAHSHASTLVEQDLPAVLVDEELQMLRVYGDVRPFLRFKPGEPSLSLLHVLEQPAIHLEVAARKARSDECAVTIGGLPDPVTGELTLSLRVTPLTTPEGGASRLLVSFLRGAEPAIREDESGVTTIEDVRARNETKWTEALRVTHEELEASREELQALNEELRASNDQLNLTNEELNQANLQLRGKVDELLTQSNVLSSGAVMTLLLDEDLRVRWFTPGVSELFPVKAGDVGRRITDLAPKFQRTEFLDDVRAVMANGEPREAQVRTFEGRSYLQRIRPFRTGNGQDAGAGVAINFTDVTERAAMEGALRESEQRVQKLVGLLPTGVCTCDAEGRLTFYNRRAAELWGREPDLGEGQAKFCGSFRLWNPDGTLLRHEDSPMGAAVREGRTTRNAEVIIEQPSGCRLVADVNIDLLYDREGRLAGAINVFADVSERKSVEQALRRTQARLEAELDAMQRVHAFSTAAIAAQSASEILELALDTLMRLHGSHQGTFQLLDPQAGVLRIAAQRGFEPWFLEYFAEVDPNGDSACGRALAQRERVLVEDVNTAGFDEAYREVARRAGYRAVQSTPLTTASGGPLGMISTMFPEPHVLSDAERRLTDILANELASALERIHAVQALQDRERTLRRNQGWLAAQKEAFQSAMNGGPLATSLGILARAAIEQSGGERRCAFYLADDDHGLRHVVGMPDSYAPRVDGFRWSFPVETATGKLVGSFAVYFSEPREPSAHDLELAASLTKTAAIIISKHQATSGTVNETAAHGLPSG